MMLWWALAMLARDLENKCHFGGCDKYKTKEREKSWLVVEQKKHTKPTYKNPGSANPNWLDDTVLRFMYCLLLLLLLY